MPVSSQPDIQMHLPRSPEGQAALSAALARAHAQMVCQYIQQLPCPKDARAALLESVLKSIP